MNAHFIHRPTPEGGETDDRFRELPATAEWDYVELWSVESNVWYPDHLYYSAAPGYGIIWRIPDSDAPSAETLRLARETR